MEEAVDESAGAKVVCEVVAPGVPGNVAGDDRGALLVARKEDLLHEPGPAGDGALDLLEADLVEDEELGRGVGLEGVLEGVVGEAGVEVLEHGGARGVADAEVRGARVQGEGEGEVALARAAHAGEQDVLPGGDEGERPELEDEVLVERGLEGEVECLERLALREPRLANAPLDAGLVAVADLRLQQRPEPLEPGLVGLGVADELVEARARVRQAQRGERVADAARELSRVGLGRLLGLGRRVGLLALGLGLLAHGLAPRGRSGGRR